MAFSTYRMKNNVSAIDATTSLLLHTFGVATDAGGSPRSPVIVEGAIYSVGAFGGIVKYQ